MTANQGNFSNEEVKLVDRQKVDAFILTNQKFFPAEKIIFLKEKLYQLEESKFSLISCVELKNPTTILLFSLFLGWLGVDRFMLKDTAMGVLKLLTGGCCCILTIVDWFTIQGKTKERNFNNLMMLL